MNSDENAPAARDAWIGEWQTNWGPLTLAATDARELEGRYGELDHALAGTIDAKKGKSLAGTWQHSDSDQHGRFRFQLTKPDEFAGAWTYGDGDPALESTNWRGRRG